MILANVPSSTEFSPSAWAVVPIGAVEQHGLHLPLGTDFLLVSAVASALEAAAPERIVLLPTIPYGASDHHSDRSGTVSVGSQALLQYLTAAIEGLTTSSCIQSVLILNGHGGNVPAMSIAVERSRRNCPGRTVWALSYWDAMFDHLGETGTTAMGHADHIETSMMLHVDASLVGNDRVSDSHLLHRPAWLRTSETMPAVTATGAVGDPTGATPEAGDRFLAAAVAGILSVLDGPPEVDGQVSPRLDRMT